MHYSDKLDEQEITNIIKRHIKPIGKRKTNKTYHRLLNLKHQTTSLKITPIPLKYT